MASPFFTAFILRSESSVV